MQLQVQKKKEWINIGKEAIPRNPKVSTERKCTEMYCKFEKVVRYDGTRVGICVHWTVDYSSKTH